MYYKERYRYGCIVLVLILSIQSGLGDFTTSCPRPCDCKWQSGNKAADCASGGLDAIPKNLSSDIQILDLAGNPLFEITQHAFEIVGLSNLKKLVLKECSLISIHRDAFSNLGIMIELDLSKNNISTLNADTFKETEKLRWINLSNNRIEKLDDGLFRNMEYLQRVELSNNQLLRLGMKTFMNLPRIQILRLDGNNLTHMNLESVNSLVGLSSLDLHNNPWRCDCNLQAFRNWVIKRNLYTPPTSCAEPPQHYEKHWSDLNSSDFACKPTILYPTSGTVIKTNEENVTLRCKAFGNPTPDVNWVFNSRIIASDNRKHGDQRYIIHRSTTDLTKWVNLTIVHVRYLDRGDFTCVASNPGGLAERNLTLAVSRGGHIEGAGTSENDMLPILIGLTCGASILLIIVIVLCFCFCRKRDPKRHIKTEVHSPNGDAMLEGSVIPEMEKSLLTVNPVTKPPRRYDAPPSITSGATEMSELNRTLLDNDSVFAPNEDENRSLEFERMHNKHQHDSMSSEYGRIEPRAAFPPDLLAFPPAHATPVTHAILAPSAPRMQLSPAASCASTLPDNSRLPQQYPQSPLHSPIYGTNPNLFRTLPYSRSQSPFSTPTVCASAAVTPRQGYVTIPRRPRVPSWSSTASTVMTQVLPTSEAQEPLYDNLGLRTTADGSSVLSLNKAGLPEVTPSFTMRNRPLPATPTAFQSPVFYAPIEEHEPVPSPAPATPRSNTSRNSLSSPNIHHQLLSTLTTSTPQPGPQEPSNRASWAKSPPEPAVRTHKAYNGVETGTLKKRDSIAEDQLKDTSVTFFPNGTLGRSGKIPPRPPPKPKKKTQTTDSNEPLFEDEGEDGTEV